MGKYFKIFIGILVIMVTPLSGCKCNEMCTNDVIEDVCLTFIESIPSLIQNYKTLLKTSPKYLCHLKVKITIDREMKKLRKLIDKEIQDTGKDHLANLDEMITILQTARNDYLHPKVDASSTDDEYLHLGHNSYNQLISSIYGNNISNAEKVIDFFDSLPDDDETIQGYRLLYDQMIKNNHLYSTLTTTIGYRALKFIKERKSENENLLYIRDNLPESLKNFTNIYQIYIDNAKGDERLATGLTNFLFDEKRRLVVTNVAGRESPFSMSSDWIINPVLNGRYFQIYIDGFDIKQYLYADSNELSRDIYRRNVFLWKNSDSTPIDKARWMIEPINGSSSFKIKNVYWNEYLFIDDGFVMTTRSEFRHVFTNRREGCDYDGCKWQIIRRK